MVSLTRMPGISRDIYPSKIDDDVNNTCCKRTNIEWENEHVSGFTRLVKVGGFVEPNCNVM